MKIDSKTIAGALKKYGFSENEAVIYIFLIKRLEATAFEIAKETGIPRTTVYQTIEKLKKQGIITQFRKNNVAYFTPESPNQLFRLLAEKEQVLSAVMPEIQAIMSRGFDKPITKLYVGTDGIKTLLEDMLVAIKDQKVKQIYATSQPELMDLLPKYFPTWLTRREKMGVFTRLILPHESTDFLPANELREVRYLPENFPFSCSLTMCGNRIAFFDFQAEEPYGVSIESSSIAKMLTQFFLFTWEMLASKPVKTDK